LNGIQFGLLTSTPVLTGALFRLPLGIWTDRFDGRIVMFLLLVVCAVPLWLSSYGSCFMFLYGIVWVSLILNYTTEVRRLPVMGEQVLIGATSIPSVTAVASSKTGARP